MKKPHAGENEGKIVGKLEQRKISMLAQRKEKNA
jgi:hypothetical protein